MHTPTPHPLPLAVGSMRRESDSGYAPTPLDLAHISFDDDDDLQLLQVRRSLLQFSTLLCLAQPAPPPHVAAGGLITRR